jgi:hypothetical protein
MKLDQTKKALTTFAKNVVKKSRANLRKKSATGNLKHSVNYELDVFPNSFALEFWMLDYGRFQDAGVDGKKKKWGARKYGAETYSYTTKMPPPKALDSWVVKRGLAPRNKKGQFKGRSISTVGFQQSITFLIARHIFMKGLKPSYFFSKPFQEEFDKLPRELVDKYGLDIDKFLDSIIDL